MKIKLNAICNCNFLQFNSHLNLILGKDRFVACACNVGDSLAYVYNPTEGHVREITQGSHDIQSNRDMRDALGEEVRRRYFSRQYENLSDKQSLTRLTENFSTFYPNDPNT